MLDLTSLVTANDAAYYAGVEAATIRKWVAREQLAVAEVDARGRNMFRLIDVAKAERATREKARRHVA